MRQQSPLIIWASPAIVVAGFLATAAVSRYAPDSLRRMIIAAAVAMPVLIASLCIHICRREGRAVAVALASTPTVLVAGAYGLFLVVSNDAARAAVLAVTAVLCGFYFTYLIGMSGGDARFQREDFLHLSFVTHVVTMFFVLAGAFGVSGFTSLSTPAVATCVSIVALLTAAETFRRAGILATGAPFAFVFALLAAEMVAALSILPTSGLVNATVGTVLYAAGLRMATWSLTGKTDGRASRRQMALSFFLVILVLSTARWN